MSDDNLRKIREYQKILLKNPRSSLFAMLAESYRRMGRLQEALEVTRKGLEYKPDFVSGLVVHAKVLFDLKEYRLAIQNFEKSLALSPKNLLSLRFTALCYLKMGQRQKAMNYINELLRLNPEDREALELVRQIESPDTPDLSSDIPDGEEAKNEGDPAEQFEPFSIPTPIKEETIPEPKGQGKKGWNDSPDFSFMEEQNRVNPALMELQNRKEFYQKMLQRIVQDI